MRELFAEQLLITDPNPDRQLYPTDLEWLETRFPDGSTWPNGLGHCYGNVTQTIHSRLAQTNRNIYARINTRLSRKQEYNFLAKARLRPDR